MLNYITPAEFFIILVFGLIGWTFACAFGIGLTFELGRKFKKWFDTRRYYNGGNGK